MKSILTAAAMVVVLLVTGNSLNAQNKTGYISFQDLVAVMPETAKADSSYKVYQEQKVKSAEKKNANFEKELADFYKDSINLSAEVKQARREDLQKFVTELSGMEETIQKELQKKQEELMAPIQKKAFESLQAVAKENGYTYVFDAGTLLIAPPGDDLLPLVAKKLKIKLPEADAAPKPAAPKTN
jgi:outer membrane protein